MCRFSDTKHFAPEGKSYAGAPPQYEMIKLLGRGRYGKVVKAENTATGKHVAIKVIKSGKMNPDAMKKEVSHHGRLKHRHIVNVHDAIMQDGCHILVMEYVSNWNLRRYIAAEKKLCEEEARRLFQQLIPAVECCHSHGIVHRNIKPENVLLDRDLNVKLADFGLSEEFDRVEPLMQACGSPGYAAPELLRPYCEYMGPEVDVWACGVVFYVMLCGRLPFDGKTTSDIFRRTRRGDYQVPRSMSIDGRELLAGMLKVDVDLRISIEDIQQSCWFQTDLPEDWGAAAPEGRSDNDMPTRVEAHVLPRLLGRKNSDLDGGDCDRCGSEEPVETI